MGYGKTPAPPASTPRAVPVSHRTRNTHLTPWLPPTRHHGDAHSIRNAGAVLPRGWFHAGVGLVTPEWRQGALECNTDPCARSGDPAPGPLGRGSSRRRAKNGVLARRHHAGLLSCLQVFALVVLVARSRTVRLIVMSPSSLTPHASAGRIMAEGTEYRPLFAEHSSPKTKP
jgi:hypothetical protein